jgi:seryl-tRNA synthetase
MLDVSKLQRRAQIAKSMVERGLVANLEEAYEKIDQDNMVNNKGEDSKFFSKKDEETVFNEDDNKNSNDSQTSVQDRVNPKFDVISQNISVLATAIQEISKNIINLNMKMNELDNKLNNISTKIENISLQSSCCSDSCATFEKPKENNDISRSSNESLNDAESTKNDNFFAVEKIFNNSHGKLTRK